MQVTHLGFEKHKVSFEVRDPENWMQRARASEHTFYEEEMLADIKRRIAPDSVIVDIGANIGNHTLFFAAVCRARVVAIEPFPANYDHLVRNVALNQLSDRVTALNLAVGDRRGRGAFEVPNPKHAGTVKVRPDGGAGEVDIVPLDELTLPGAPDLLKIDIEGAELAALAGAERTIRAHRPLVYLEVWTPLVLNKVIAFFEAADYRLVAGFNEDPTFLFAHRDDPRAPDKPDGVAAGLAMLAIARYQGRRRAAQERRQRKGQAPGKAPFKKRLLRAVGRLRTLIGRNEGKGAPAPPFLELNVGTARSPAEATPTPVCPARAAPPKPEAGAAPLEETCLATVIREGREHLQARAAAWAETGLPFTPVRDQTAIPGAGSGGGGELPLVTILLATNRSDNLLNCRRNLICQDYPDIEPIVIVNKDDFDLEEVKSTLGDLPRLQVIRVPEHQTLGTCLNEGIALGRGAYFAKLDDDDLYGPRYISDLVCTARRTNAGLSGKTRCFYYYPATGKLFLRASHRGRVAGATLLFTAEVARSVRFPTNVTAGSDGGFIQECQRRGVTITSTDPFNFCVIRHRDMARHTWVATDKSLFDNATLVCQGLRSDIIDI